MNRSMISLRSSQLNCPPFVQKTEQQWKGNAFVGDAESEYIDVELSELPVGAVHTQNQTVLNRKQREDHPCYQVEVQGIVGDESLNAAQIGITLNRRRHCRSQFVKAHSLHHTKCMQRYKPCLMRARFIDFPKYSCIIGRIWLTLAKSLESVVFIEKAANFSFKVTDFQGLLQI